MHGVLFYFSVSLFSFFQPPSSITMQSVASQVGEKRQTFQGTKEKKKVQCDSVCFLAQQLL